MPLDDTDLARIKVIVDRSVREALSASPANPLIPRMTVAEFAHVVNRRPYTILTMIRSRKIDPKHVDKGRPFRISAGALAQFNVNAGEARLRLDNLPASS